MGTFHQITVVAVLYQPVKMFKFLANSFWYTVINTKHEILFTSSVEEGMNYKKVKYCGHP